MTFTGLMKTNDTTRNEGRGATRTSAEASGRLAEEMAARFLEKRGLRILARNYRCRGGEIDLIVRDGKTLVFVEVRLRSNPAFGGAGESITLSKQRRIILAARHYLAEQATGDIDCRFDCLLFAAASENRIEWLRDAFAAG